MSIDTLVCFWRVGFILQWSCILEGCKTCLHMKKNEKTKKKKKVVEKKKKKQTDIETN